MQKTQNKIIQKNIAIIIKNLINIKNDNLITITSAEINKDYSKAIIYASSLKNEEEIIKILNMNKKYIKHELTKKIKKYTKLEIEFKTNKNINCELIIENINKKNEN